PVKHSMNSRKPPNSIPTRSTHTTTSANSFWRLAAGNRPSPNSRPLSASTPTTLAPDAAMRRQRRHDGRMPPRGSAMTSIDGTMGGSDSSKTRWLAGAMDDQVERPVRWNADELATMLRHQLNSPIRTDVKKMSGELLARFDQAAAGASGAATMSFGSLFGANQPNVKVLQVVKDFAKQSISQKDGSLPEELGAVLYYASICTALLRCNGQRISGLDNETLKDGLNWSIAQPWLDASLATLLRATVKTLAPST